MFNSFFPRPRWFFLSAFGWFLLSLAALYGFAESMMDQLSLFKPDELTTGDAAQSTFLTAEKSWVYQYIVLSVVLFCLAWAFLGRSRWYVWSVVGTAVIVVVTYFSVQITVWLNEWYRAFYDLIQRALSEPGSVTLAEYYGTISTAVYILVPYILIRVLFSYFVSHYVFRWRTAMNNYYMEHWPKLRHIEGAAQRVQEDTMRFAGIVEGLGARLIDSLMTLIAFLPVLWNLSQHVTELPIIGPVEGSLVFVALISSMFGTVLLAVVGIRLPGLEFNNQLVEAAYRKELVYGEDYVDRAAPPTAKELFSEVRKNYFKLYFNYLYFNVFRFAYLQGSNFAPFIALGPTVVTGAITFGLFQQIMNAFNQVESSFQYLVNSWTTIVELMSIYKRLAAFESVLDVDGTDTPLTMGA